MSEIQRYKPGTYHTLEGTAYAMMTPHIHGRFVSYDDHLNETKRLRQALETIALFGETEGSPFALSAAKTARKALASAEQQNTNKG